MTVQKMCFFNKQIIAIYILNLRLLLISSGFWQCLWRRWWRHRALHQALWMLRLHIPVEGVSCLHQILGARDRLGSPCSPICFWKVEKQLAWTENIRWPWWPCNHPNFSQTFVFTWWASLNPKTKSYLKTTFTCMTSRDENDKNKHTVDGRNPANRLVCIKPL